MRERVLDASVVLKWFARAEPGAAAAARIRAEFEAGDLTCMAPSLLCLEILNVAGRGWGWDGVALAETAAAMDDLPFVIIEPPLAAIATWVAAGLTAYDAAYVAVAETTGTPLVTDDATILRAAPHLTEPLT